MLIYPMSSGRNLAEILRLLDSIQLTAKHAVATPVNWNPGGECIIAPSLADEQAKEKFPGGWKTVKPYLRSEEHTSELQSLMRISYAVFCLKKKTTNNRQLRTTSTTSNNQQQ